MTSIVTTLLACSTLLTAPLVVGHRGDGGTSPAKPFHENSLLSIEHAFAEGADLVEIDVQLDAQGRVILWHDRHVRFDPATRRRVRDVPLEHMPPLVAPCGTPTHVPTLEQALAVALRRGPHRLVLDIELKVYFPEDRGRLVQRVGRILYEKNALDRVLVSSYDLHALRLLKEWLPQVETGLIAAVPMLDWSTFQQERARGLKIEWFLPRRQYRPWTMFPQNLVREARAEGVRIGVWTVNRPSHIEAFVAAGYDMIITDEPRRAREIVDGLREPGLFDPAAEWIRESRLVPQLLLSF